MNTKFGMIKCVRTSGFINVNQPTNLLLICDTLPVVDRNRVENVLQYILLSVSTFTC